MKKFLLVFTALVSCLMPFWGVPPPAFAEDIPVTYTAVQEGGVSGVKDTERIIVTFDTELINLSNQTITLDGATASTMVLNVGKDPERKTCEIEISDITVGNGEAVTLTIDDFGQGEPFDTYRVGNKTQQVTVYRDTRERVSFAVSQVGGIAGEADTTGLLIVFDKPVTGLTADKIRLEGARPGKGDLHDNGDGTWLLDVAVGDRWGTVVVYIDDWTGYHFDPGYAHVDIHKDPYTHVTFIVEQVGGVDGMADTTALAVTFTHTEDGTLLPSSARSAKLSVAGASVTGRAVEGWGEGRDLLYLDPDSFGNGDELTLSAPEWRSIKNYKPGNSPSVKVFRDTRYGLSYTAQAIERYDQYGVVDGTAGILVKFNQPVPKRVPEAFSINMTCGEWTDDGDNDGSTWYVPVTHSGQLSANATLRLPSDDPEYRLVSPRPNYIPQCVIPLIMDQRTTLCLSFSCDGFIHNIEPSLNSQTTSYVNLRIDSYKAFPYSPHNLFTLNDLPWAKIGSKTFYPNWKRTSDYNYRFMLSESGITNFSHGDKLTLVFPDLDRTRFHDPEMNTSTSLTLTRKPFPPDGRRLVSVSPASSYKVSEIVLGGTFTAGDGSAKVSEIRFRESDGEQAETLTLNPALEATVIQKYLPGIDVSEVQMLKQPGVYEVAFVCTDGYESDFMSVEVMDTPAYSGNGYGILAVTQDGSGNLGLAPCQNESDFKKVANVLIEFRGFITEAATGEYEVLSGSTINKALIFADYGEGGTINIRMSGGNVAIKADKGVLLWNSIPLTPRPGLSGGALQGFESTLESSKKYRAVRNGDGDADVEISSVATNNVNIFIAEAEMKTIRLYKNAVSIGGMVRLGAAMEILGDAAEAKLELKEMILDNNPDTIIPLMHVEGGISLNPGKILGLGDVIKAGGELGFELNTLPETVPNYIGIKGELDISELLFVEGEFVLAWREFNGIPVFVPDTVYFFARSGKGGIPLVPPTVVAYITGFGGGFTGLGGTILGNYPQVPPVKLMLSGAIQDVTTSLIDIKKATLTVGPSEFSAYANSATFLKFLTLTEVGVAVGMADPEYIPPGWPWLPNLYLQAEGKISLLNNFLKGSARFRGEVYTSALGDSLVKLFQKISDEGIDDLTPAEVNRVLEAFDVQGEVFGQAGVETPVGLFGGNLNAAINKKNMTIAGKLKGSIGPFSKTLSLTYYVAKNQLDFNVFSIGAGQGSKGADGGRVALTNLRSIGMYRPGANTMRAMSRFGSLAVNTIEIPDMTSGDIAALYSTEKPMYIRVYRDGVQQSPFVAEWLDGVSGVPGYEDGEVYVANYVVTDDGDWAFEADGLLDGAHIRIDPVPSFEYVSANLNSDKLEVIWGLDDAAAGAGYDMWVSLTLVDANTGKIANNIITPEGVENDLPKYSYPEAGKGEYAVALPRTLPSGSYYVSARLFRMTTVEDEENGGLIDIEETIDMLDGDAFEYTNPLTPGKPGNVTVEYAGNGAVTMKWDAVAANTADGYTVMVLHENGAPVSNIGHVNVSDTDTETTLNYGFATYDNDPEKTVGSSTSVLDYGKTYQFSVQAYRLHTIETGTGENREAYDLPVYGDAGTASYTIQEPQNPLLTISAGGTRRRGRRSEKITADATTINNLKPDIRIESDIETDIAVYLNGGETPVASGRGGPGSPLEFSCEFEEDGMYTLRAEGVNGKDTGGATLNLIVDTTPPFLDVDESSFTVSNGKVRVTGFVEAGARLVADGNRIVPNDGDLAGGVFEFEAPAGEAVTDIYITARDRAGNTAKRVFTILSPATSTSMSVSELNSFGSLNTPYTQPAEQTVTITNTGTDPITLEEPAVTNAASNYAIGALSTTNLAVGGVATFTVQPRADLQAGDYQETIRIAGNDGALTTVTARFTVIAQIDPNNSAVINGTTIDLGSNADGMGWEWDVASKTLTLTGGDVDAISITTADDITITVADDASATNIVNNGTGGMTITGGPGRELTLNSASGPAIGAQGDIVIESGTIYALTTEPGASAIESTGGNVTIGGDANVIAETITGAGSAISAAGTITISTIGNVKATTDIGYGLEATTIAISGGITELFFDEENGGDAYRATPDITGSSTVIWENGILTHPTISVSVTSITVTGAGNATTITTGGGTLQMLADVEPADATLQTVTWSVTPPTVATIGAGGLLTAKGDGTATVRATANDGSGVEGTLEIAISGQTPSVPVTGITVTGAGNVTTITTDGGTLQMLADVEPADATLQTVTWSVTPQTVATIGAGGLLTAKGDGTATVRATANDGSGVEGTLVITISGQTTAPPPDGDDSPDDGGAPGGDDDGDDGDDGRIVPPGGETITLPGGIEVKLPGGTVIDPDGTITLPSNGTGTVTLPGDVEAKLPGGTVIDPDGTITLPSNGTGTVTLPGGIEVKLPGGTVIDPDGTITLPSNGTGTVTLPGGAEARLPGGTVIDPDGTINLPPNATITIATSDNNVTVDLAGSLKVESDGTIRLLPDTTGKVTITTANGTKIVFSVGRIVEGDETFAASIAAVVEGVNDVRSLAAAPLYLHVFVGQGGAEIAYPAPDGSTETVADGYVIKINPDGSTVILKGGSVPGDPDDPDSDTTEDSGGGGCNAAGAAGALAALAFLGLKKRPR